MISSFKKFELKFVQHGLFDLKIDTKYLLSNLKGARTIHLKGQIYHRKAYLVPEVEAPLLDIGQRI